MVTLLGDSCGEINQTVQSVCFLGWLFVQEGFTQVLPLHGLLWGLVSLNSLLLSAGLAVNWGQGLPVAEHKSQSSVLKTSDVCWGESVDLWGPTFLKVLHRKDAKGLQSSCVL